MQVKSIAEYSPWSILQYFWPSLNYHLSLRPLFCLFLSGHLRQVLLYNKRQVPYLICVYGKCFKISNTFLVLSNGIARMLKRLCTSKGDYWIKKWFSSIVSLFKMGTSLKGSEFFPLRAVPYGMENHFYHIRWPPLNVNYFYYAPASLWNGSNANAVYNKILAVRAWILPTACQNSKQRRPWSDCFLRSSPIWVCTICLGIFGKQ